MDEAKDWYGPDAATFGDRVAAAREMADMAQAELARRPDVRLATLRSRENDLSEPRANRLSMMAGLMNVPMRWFITGEGHGVDAPLEDCQVPSSVQDIPNELRDVRTDMLTRAEQIGPLEKKMRAVRRDGSDDGIA